MSEIYLIDYYANILKSPLHTLNPLTKVVFLVFILLSIILSTSISSLLLVFCLLIFLIILAKLPLFKILQWSLYPLFFASLFVISQIHYGTLPLITLLRALNAAVCLLFIFCTTPYPAIFSLLAKISQPLGLLFFLTYRYFFLIIDELQTKIKLMKVRGGFNQPSKVLKNLAFAIGHFLIYALEKGERCYDILLIRGYRGRMLVKIDRRLRISDFVFMFLSFLIFIVLVRV